MRLSTTLAAAALLAAPATAEAVKAGSVTGRAIKDGTIAERDLSASLRAALKRPLPAGPTGPTGAAGPAGPAGEKGEPGTPAPSYTAGAGLKLDALAFSLDTAFAQRRVTGACPAGQAIRAIAEAGTVTCQAMTAASGGDITGVAPAAGSGLTGGGATGDVTLGTDPNVLQKRIGTACAAGTAMTAVATTGAPACAAYGDVTGITPVAGSGLTGGGAGGALTIGTDANVLQKRIATPCPAGQAMTAVAASGAPTCAAYGDLTGVSAGTGLTGGGTSGSPTLSVQVPLALTGASDAVPTIKAVNNGPGTSDWPNWPTGLRAEGAIGAYGVGRVYGVVGDGGDGGIGIRGLGDPAVQAFGVREGLVARADDAIRADGESRGIIAGASSPGGIGVQAWGGTSGLAGWFNGNVKVDGTLTKAAGTFRIDHPQDPRNKTLSHSFVESPEMMNLYRGSVRTDAKGFATVRMPGYFDALNRTFEYQLTVIGRTFARAVVWQEIEGDRFVIRTDEPRVKVSWQVSGARDDAYARRFPTPVEELKPAAERGRYLNSEAFR